MYKINDVKYLTFGIKNNLNVPLKFIVGSPFWIQYYDRNGSWQNISLGEGTQASWLLAPGETHNWDLKREALFDWSSYPDGSKPFTIIPGIYRVLIFGETYSEKPEDIRLQIEFVIE